MTVRLMVQAEERGRDGTSLLQEAGGSRQEALLRGVAIAAMFALPFSVSAEDIAMVTDCGPGVQVTTEAGTEACEILMGLAAGAELSVPDGETLVLVHLPKGSEYRLAGPGSATVVDEGLLNAAGLEIEAGSLDLLAAVDIDPSEAGYAQAGMVMRGSNQARVQLMMPVETMILTQRPEFVWGSVEGAAEYLFVLLDETGQQILEIPTLEPRVEMPSGLSLEAGRYYTWRIEAFMARGQTFTASAEFNVASDTLRNYVARFQPDTHAPFSERALFAVFLQTVGLSDLARAHYEQLASERPESALLQARSGN